MMGTQSKHRAELRGAGRGDDYDDRVVANMEKHEFAIRSALLDVMRRVDETTLSEPNFRKDLAERMKTAINAVLENYEDFGGVEAVLFTEFVVQ